MLKYYFLKMEEQKLNKSNLDLSEQFIIPLQRDLHNCKRHKIPVIFKIPFAVFVKKMAFTNKNNWTKSWKVDKEVIQKDCKDFSNFDFLVNFQYKKGVTFNSDEMEYFEKVQQISELKNICMPEKNPKQTLREFSDQLGEWILRNNRKIIIPVLDPSTNQLEEKTLLMKKKGLDKCAVIFRGFKKKQDKKELSKILANLRSVGIFSFAFGVNPAKWKKTKASMLYPLIYFKANGISSWIAWRGWKTPMTLLCSDWIYKDLKIADDGLSNYNGKARKELLGKKKSVNFNTSLSQIDAINQATELSRNLKPLTKIQFEKLFS